MLFNSIEFAFFLPVVFVLYWFVTSKNLKIQNLLLLGASYFFYAWWDWRFLGLIVFSSVLDYYIGKRLANVSKVTTRKWLLASSILVNLGFLGFFKYFNFFAESFAEAFTLFGANMSINRLSIILPVGISFYTFQTLSYTIDVYRKNMEPSKDIISFLAFVSFFPQLVAGPIERASNLLPQFHKKRIFNNAQASDGMRQILWGLAKKVLIADNCAYYVDIIFDSPESCAPLMLIFGAVLFAFQIYGDFSGYSDIAIGTAKLFGFNLMQNFAHPYFSRDIAEFWRRWHISLSTWFRDYVYIPLGGSRGATWKQIRNVFIIFIVSGFWHGANWTFIFWGFLNALYFLPLLLRKKNRQHTNSVAENSWLPSFKELLGMAVTFMLTVFAWIFFRADSLSSAFNYIAGMFATDVIKNPYQFAQAHYIMLAGVVAFVLVEWHGRRQQYAIETMGIQKPRFVRYTMYYALFMAIILFGGKEQSFIYFQF